MASEDDDLGRFDNICDIQETRDKAKEIYRLVKSNPNVSSLGTVALAAICAYVASSRLGNSDVQRNLALTASSLATMADFESGVSTVEYALGGGHQGRKSRSSTHGFYDRLIEEHRLTAVSGFLKRSMRKAEDFLVMQAVFDIDNREIKYAIFYWIHAILMPNVRLDHEALLEETGDTGKFDRIVQLLTNRAVHLKEQITAERGEHVSALPSPYPTPSKTPTRAQRRAKPERLPSHFDANKDTTPTHSLTLKIPRLSSDNSSSSSPRRSPVLHTSEASIDGAPSKLPGDAQEDGYVEMLKIHEQAGESTTQGLEAQEGFPHMLQTYMRRKLAESPKLPDAQQLTPEEKISALTAGLEEKEAALSAANANAEILQAELSSLEKDLKNKDSELAVATETITNLQSEMQKQSFEHQQELAMLKNKLEDAQYSKKTRQEPPDLCENAGEASVGLIVMSVDSVLEFKRRARCQALKPQVINISKWMQHYNYQEADRKVIRVASVPRELRLTRSFNIEAEHSRFQRDESFGEELEEFQDGNSHQGDMLKDEIQRLQDENFMITTRYKRKIDALKRQITSERITRQQQDILEYLNITAQSTRLSEAIDGYEPRSETSRHVLMAVKSHLRALNAIGERRRNIPLKYDKLVEVVTNRYGIKEEEEEDFDLWGVQGEDEDEDEGLDTAALEPRHKKRKVASVS